MHLVVKIEFNTFFEFPLLVMGVCHALPPLVFDCLTTMPGKRDIQCGIRSKPGYNPTGLFLDCWRNIDEPTLVIIDPFWALLIEGTFGRTRHPSIRQILFRVGCFSKQEFFSKDARWAKKEKG